jgi:hypothetical protein
MLAKEGGLTGAELYMLGSCVEQLGPYPTEQVRGRLRDLALDPLRPPELRTAALSALARAGSEAELPLFIALAMPEQPTALRERVALHLDELHAEDAASALLACAADSARPAAQRVTCLQAIELLDSDFDGDGGAAEQLGKLLDAAPQEQTDQWMSTICAVSLEFRKRGGFAARRHSDDDRLRCSESAVRGSTSEGPDRRRVRAAGRFLGNGSSAEDGTEEPVSKMREAVARGDTEGFTQALLEAGISENSVALAYLRTVAMDSEGVDREIRMLATQTLLEDPARESLLIRETFSKHHPTR